LSHTALVKGVNHANVDGVYVRRDAQRMRMTPAAASASISPAAATAAAAAVSSVAVIHT